MATTMKIAPAAKPQSQPMPTAAKSSPAAAPALAEIPDWVTETPEPQEYLLTVIDYCSGDHRQCIELTVEEYEALKRHLAAIRGYRLSEDAKSTA